MIDCKQENKSFMIKSREKKTNRLIKEPVAKYKLFYFFSPMLKENIPDNYPTMKNSSFFFLLNIYIRKKSQTNFPIIDNVLYENFLNH